VQRILVIRAGALGDTLMATPVVPALARRYPGARIDFLASAPAAPLLHGVAGLGHVIPLSQRNVPYWLSLEKLALVRRLRRERYDLAVVLEHAARYYELVERAGVPRIAGFRTTGFDPARHSIANNLRAAGFEDADRHDWRTLITAADEEYGPARDLVAKRTGPLVGVHVGYGPARRKKDQERRLRGWALENFAAVAARVIERGARIVLTGARGDRPAVERLAAMLPPENVFDVSGRTTLRQSIWMIRNLDVFVSVDSGPAHIAAAVGTPLVVLWGPGIFEQTRPVACAGPVDVVREPVACAPCYGTPMMKACRRNICMEGITPDRVVAAVARALTVRPSLRPPA
jgi:ADP-heptose:LPS heptosyltransferase